MASPWYVEQIAGWERALASLRSQGWTAKLITAAAPVQVRGVLPTGEQFYFRARHDEASITIGGDEDVDGSSWSASESCEEASSLPGDRGLSTIQRMWDEYRLGS